MGAVAFFLKNNYTCIWESVACFLGDQAYL